MANKRANRVFLNFPFDDDYEPLYVALVASITAFGLTPRCVLEIPPHENARLDRLRSIIAACGASVHDLSCVSVSGDPPAPRFNMPFELGLALGIHRSNHRWFVLERVRHRVTRSLSDLGGYDPGIHDGDAQGVLRAIANAFGASRREVRHSDLMTLWRALDRIAPLVRAERGGLFTPRAFEDLVFAAQQQAQSHFTTDPT